MFNRLHFFLFRSRGAKEGRKCWCRRRSGRGHGLAAAWGLERGAWRGHGAAAPKPPPGGAGSGRAVRRGAQGAGAPARGRAARARGPQAGQSDPGRRRAGRKEGGLRWHRPGGVPGRGWVGDGAGLTPAGGARSWAGAGLTPDGPLRRGPWAQRWRGWVGGLGWVWARGGRRNAPAPAGGGGPRVEGGVGTGPSPATVSHGRRLFVIKDLRRKHVLQYRFAGQHCGSNRSLLLIFTSLLPITATFLLPLLPVVHHYYVKTGPLLLIFTAVITSFLPIITSVHYYLLSLLPVVPVIKNPLLQ